MSNPRNNITMTTQNDHQQTYTQPTNSTQTVTQPYPYPPQQQHNNVVYNNQPPYPPQPQNHTVVYGNQPHQQHVHGPQLRTTPGQVTNTHATMWGGNYHQHEHDNHHKNSKKSLKHQLEDVVHTVFKKR